MNKVIQILATQEVKDVQVLTIVNATYKNSAPFGGNFRVWDLDHCYQRDESTGKVMVTVFCQLGNENIDDPDAELVFEYLDRVNLGCDGFDGEIISRITVDSFAQRVLNVLKFAHADQHESQDRLRLELSPNAQWRYGQLYRTELNDDSIVSVRGTRIDDLEGILAGL